MKRQKHIVVAIPCYTGVVHVGMMRSLMHDLVALISRGDIVQVAEEVGNADISNCRAMIVAKFLANKAATHLVMIDDDVCWEAHGLKRLVDANLDFVCGAYPRRMGDDIRYHIHLKDGQQSLDPTTQLLEVEAMPAGFMCLSRSMLERMVQHYADMKFSFPQSPNGYAWDLFDGYWTKDETGMRHKFGEDYAFCKRWRDIGGKIWVDPMISMGHLGTKMWSGRFADSFRPAPVEVAA